MKEKGTDGHQLESLGHRIPFFPAAVIFDMDGTLVATTESDFLAWQRVFSDHGRPLSFDDYFPLLGQKSQDVVEKGLGIFGEQVAEILARKMAYFEEVVNEKGINVLPGAEQLLQRLAEKNIPLALATSSRKMKMELVLQHSGLGKYFNHKISGEQVQQGKPNPDIFLLAAERLQVQPAECIVFEDAVSGVRAAKRAGMYCMAISSTHDKSELHEADYIFDDYGDLSLGEFMKTLIG